MNRETDRLRPENLLLAGLAEPTRLRIVELLAAAPRTVGELAGALGALQPQTTKHVQALESCGLVTVHHLGKRRVVALRREALRELAAWAGTLAAAHPAESVLEQYQRAIEAESAQLATEGNRGTRTIRLRQRVPAERGVVWRAWTDAAVLARWWAPDFFEVVRCEVVAVVGGALTLTLREGDGTEHTATGRFVAIRPGQELRYVMSPLDSAGAPLLTSTNDVVFAPGDAHTDIDLTMRVSNIQGNAAAVLAGMRPGWQQALAKLAAMLRADSVS